MALLCGIDVGTTGLKLGLFRPDGEPAGITSIEYAFQSPQEGFAEMEGALYWEAIKKGLAECCRQGACKPSEVDAIGVSSTGQAFLLTDDAGRELTPMIVWLDRRGDEFVDVIRERFGEETYGKTTGIPVIVGLTTAPKVLWYRNHEPDLLRQARHLLLIDAYTIWRLTGNRVGSSSIAASSGLWKVGEDRWWDEMLELVGLRPEQLHEVREAAEIGGTVSAQAAAETGLREGVAVAVGTNDQIAAMLGAANVEPGIFTDSTGTAMAVFTVVEPPSDHTSSEHIAYLGRGVIPGLSVKASFCNTSGILLKWLRESLGFSESYEEMDKLAATAAPGSGGITICPHFEGTLFPEPLPNAAGIIAGLRLRHGKAELFRAFFEAVAFSLRENLEHLGANAQTDTVRSLGGAAKSEFWLQMKADVTGMTVEKPVCQEAAVLGDSIIAAKAIGLCESMAEAAKGIVRIERLFKPNPDLKPTYDKAYARYRELIRLNYQA